MIPKEIYKHIQSGWWTVLISIGIVVAILAFLGALQSAWFVFLTAAGILFICMLLFYSLTVIIDNDFVRIKFGMGLIGKSFKLTDIKSCTIVRNKWWYGWGIHWFPTGWKPAGLLFNISGLDAVELLMNNGKVYRIGTDEPQKLHEFIQKKLTKEK